MTETEYTANWPRWCASAFRRGACDPESAVQDAVTRSLGLLPFEDDRFEAYVTMRIKGETTAQRSQMRMARRLADSLVPWVRVGYSPYDACAYVLELYPQDRMARENRVKTSCPHGHPYSAENTAVIRGKRYCRTCKREGMRRLRARAGVA